MGCVFSKCFTWAAEFMRSKPVENPPHTLHEAYDLGYDTLRPNPYPIGSPLSKEWERGKADHIDEGQW
jgi:hypothetical protein